MFVGRRFLIIFFAKPAVIGKLQEILATVSKTGDLMKTLRILIVDDHRDGADSLGWLVEELGHQVHVTYGGRQALDDVATVFRPDLMLVDLAMPDLDGCSLVKRFRQTPAFAQTRIVAITGHGDEGYRTLAMKAGCDAVLRKPVTPAHIKGALEGVAPVVADVDQAPRDSREGQTWHTATVPMGEARRTMPQ